LIAPFIRCIVENSPIIGFITEKGTQGQFGRKSLLELGATTANRKILQRFLNKSYFNYIT